MYNSLAQQAVSTSTLENEWVMTAKYNGCQTVAKLRDGSYVHIYDDVDVDDRGRKMTFKSYNVMSEQQFDAFEAEEDDWNGYDYHYEEPHVMEEDWSIMTAQIVKRVDLCGIISWEEVWDLSHCKNIDWMKEELARFQTQYPHTAFKLVVEYA